MRRQLSRLTAALKDFEQFCIGVLEQRHNMFLDVFLVDVDAERRAVVSGGHRGTDAIESAAGLDGVMTETIDDLNGLWLTATVAARTQLAEVAGTWKRLCASGSSNLS